MKKPQTCEPNVEKRLMPPSNVDQTLKMTKGLQLSEHLNEFNRIIMQLLSLLVRIEDEDKALLLLSSLPPSY